MSDRRLQDAIIRMLADAPLRDELYTGGEPLDDLGISEEQLDVLARTDPDRVERFARFLARHFYYERIVRFFKYSRALAERTGRYPESVLRSGGFDELLPTCVMGSRDTAEAVTRLVAEHLLEVTDSIEADIPYYRDLVAYQAAMMTVEAGPRVWHGESRRRRAALDSVAAPVEGTLIRQFDWDLPPALPRVLRSPERPPPAARSPTRLLFARAPRGQVTVMRCPDGLARLIEAADGRRTVRELAEELDHPPGEVLETVNAVIEAGALHRMN